MELVITETYEDMSRAAADVIAAQVTENPRSVLGLATGSTPIGLYAQLVKDYDDGLVSFADVTTFNLDEYRGLDPEHDQSYRYFMQKNLFDLVNVDPDRTHVPNGAEPDAQKACTEYEQAIALAGGVDLQLLGLGHNGHIGFNEPCDHFPVDTHVVDLTESTIQANSRLFDSADDVPRQAYTMGIGTIMKARKVLMVVSGADKADIVDAMVNGPVTPEAPASVLQLHPNVTIIVDSEAGAKCKQSGK